LLLDADPANHTALRIALRIARGRADGSVVASGVRILRGLGIASAYETEDAITPAAERRREAEAHLEDARFERMRRVAREAAQEIAAALGTPGEPEPPPPDNPEAVFRASVFEAEGRLTARALLPLPTRELADLLTLLATLILDPEHVRGDGHLINALSGALSRRKRKRLSRIFEDDSVDEIRGLDFAAWRGEVRALAAWKVFLESGGDLRTALVALIRESPDAPDAALREGADLTALIRGNRTARAFLRRVVRDWIAQI
jgi:hypothetical protein